MSEQPLSDEELQQLERSLRLLQPSGESRSARGGQWVRDDLIVRLVAEVRRLRDALRLKDADYDEAVAVLQARNADLSALRRELVAAKKLAKRQERALQEAGRPTHDDAERV